MVKSQKALLLKAGQMIMLRRNEPSQTNVAEVIEVVKKGREIVAKVRVVAEDGRITVSEITFLAEDVVMIVAGLVSSNFFGRLVNTLRNLFKFGR